MAQLAEKYRPRRLEDVAAQDRAVGMIRKLIAGPGLTGRGYWISGNSGTGKGVLAEIIAREVADEMCIFKVDAGSLSAADVDKFARMFHQYGWGKGGWALICDESQGLRSDVCRRFNVMFEPLPTNCVVIFTTTVELQAALFEAKDDASMLHARCTPIQLTRRDLCKPGAEYVKRCLMAEGIDGLPIATYEGYMKACGNSIREALNLAEREALTRAAGIVVDKE
jgi:hypothetical protein